MADPAMHAADYTPADHAADAARFATEPTLEERLARLELLVGVLLGGQDPALLPGVEPSWKTRI